MLVRSAASRASDIRSRINAAAASEKEERAVRNAAGLSQRTLFLLRPTMRGSPMPLRRTAAVRRPCLSIIQFSTPKPPLRHPEPYGFILWDVRELGHTLALSGESHDFLRGSHR